MPFPFDSVQTIGGILSSGASYTSNRRGVPIIPKQDKQDPPPPPPPPDEWGEFQQYLDSRRFSGNIGSRGNFIPDTPTLDPIFGVDPRFPGSGDINVNDPNYDLFNPYGNGSTPPDNVDWGVWLDNMRDHNRDLRDGMTGSLRDDIPWSPPVDPPHDPPPTTPIVKDIRATGRPDWLPKPGQGSKRRCEYSSMGNSYHRGSVQLFDEYGFIKNIYFYIKNEETGVWELNPELEEYGIDPKSLETGDCKVKPQKPTRGATGVPIDGQDGTASATPDTIKPPYGTATINRNFRFTGKNTSITRVNTKGQITKTASASAGAKLNTSKTYNTLNARATVGVKLDTQKISFLPDRYGLFSGTLPFHEIDNTRHVNMDKQMDDLLDQLNKLNLNLPQDSSSDPTKIINFINGVLAALAARQGIPDQLYDTKLFEGPDDITPDQKLDQETRTQLTKKFLELMSLRTELISLVEGMEDDPHYPLPPYYDKDELIKELKSKLEELDKYLRDLEWILAYW